MNHNLINKLEEYDAIGFDMDNTIAKYKMEAMLPTVWNAQVDFLIKRKGYHPSLRQVEFHPDSAHWYTACKGIVYDVDQGTLLLLKEDGSVDKALRAHQELTEEEIDILYPDKRRPHFFHDLIKNYNHGTSHVIFESSFDIVCTVLINELLSRSQSGPPHPNKDPRKIWEDVNESLDYIYDCDNEIPEDGFKHKVIEDPHRFLEKVSPTLKQFLRELRDRKKFIFFITASNPNYSHHVMKYVWGADWESSFDMVIMSSRKPHFFTQTVPFKDLNDCPVDKLQMGNSYLNGNYESLQQFLAENFASREPSVVYFGDSCRSDIIPVATRTKWDVWSIVEELEEEAMPLKGQNNISDQSPPVFVIECDEEEDDSSVTESESCGQPLGGGDTPISPTSLWALHSHPLSMPNLKNAQPSNKKCASSKNLHQDEVDLERSSKSWGCGFHCSDGRPTLWYSLIKRNSSAVLQKLGDIIDDGDKPPAVQH